MGDVNEVDAVVVGSGPNGLAAAIELGRRGAKVLVIEAASELGGGNRSAELTLPGFVHDVCAAVHPLGILSPYLRTLPLEDHGLRWIRPRASVAHPLDGQPAVLLRRSVDATVDDLGGDARAWRRLVSPFLRDPHGLLDDVMGPLRIPRHPIAMLRFGLHAMRSAAGLARGRFEGERARALFAGCAAHSILPLETPFSAAVGLLFALTAHVEDWPVAAGGSARITDALVAYHRSLGGLVETDRTVRSLADLPSARVVLFDTDPLQLATIAESILPASYVRRLRRYRFGPGVFKLDWALDGPIPWRDPRCLEASTVHVGGGLDAICASERAPFAGEHASAPFLLVCQQSEFDVTRAPEGKHTGYAYCHVPAGSTVDMTAAIERQIERFAPGFRDRILARHATSAPDFARYNRNYVGGAIAGGVADAFQLFTRPVARLDPYSTPHPALFLCSASTPPGGGVHGMCGYHAAASAWKSLERREPSRLVR